MLEELMNMVRQYGHSAVVENPAIPNEHNEDVMREAGTSIFSGLQRFANNGDTDAVSGLLKGEEDHPAVAQVQNNFADNIIHKFGINGNTAKGLAASLIPTVLRSLVRRPGSGNAGGLSLQSILASITGGGNVQQSGMLGSLGAKLGLDRDGDGDVDLKDLAGMLHRQ
jgi:hypothetical protein